ncbi:MAG TPA: DUF202 domain-containing protein [Pseudonocardiaceae bacterium]
MSEPAAGQAGGPAGGTGDGEEPDHRFTLANERTLLAWLRTALALVAAGVATVSLLPELGIPGGRHLVGVILVTMGTLLAPAAVLRWSRVQAAMRARRPLPATRVPMLLGIGLGVLGLLVLGLLIAGAQR